MIDALSPQEDEFALLALGIPSLYRGFLDPRRLPELTSWLEPDAWNNSHPKNWMDAWLLFLADVTDGRHKRLVLKSPNHTFRLRALAQIFPSASYVWLVRDPIETFLSNRKMWLAMFHRYALWDWNDSLLDTFLCKAMEHAAECLFWSTSLLSKNQLVVVRFDKLINVPLDTLEGVNRRLSLGNWAEMQTAAGQITNAQTDYRHDTYGESHLPEAILNATERLRSAQQNALSSHGL